MQGDAAFQSLRDIARRLDEIGVPYAVVGGMALVAHGYRRTTEDVDILVTAAGLAQVDDALVGLGYTPLFPGSRDLRDARTDVPIKWVVTSEYPGDGKPKPVAFPDPRSVAVESDGIRYVNLPKLIELKLASGMTNPGRLRDLADVQELIRALRFAPDFALQWHDSVRAEFRRLAEGVVDGNQC